MVNVPSVREIRRYLQKEWIRVFGHVSPDTYEPGRVFRQAVARLQYQQPPGSAVSEEEIRVCYDTIAPHAETLSLVDPEYQAHRVRFLVEKISAAKPTTVVDAGCGVGLALGFLASTFPRVRFIGYDLSPRSVERAEKRLRRLRCGNAEVVVSSHQDAPKVIAARADLLFTMGSLGGGREFLPARSTFDEEHEWRALLACDPVVQKRTEDLAAICRLLTPDRTYINIQPVTEDEYRLFIVVAETANLTPNGQVLQTFPHPMKDALVATMACELGEAEAQRFACLAGMPPRPFTEVMIFRQT